MADIPKPPDTKPRGGAHTTVDTHSLAERAKDEAHDAKKIAQHADNRSMESLQLSRDHAAMIEETRKDVHEMKAMLKVALTPVVVSRPVRYAAYAAAAALALLAALGCYVVFFARAPIASAAPSGQGTQAVYRVP